MSARRRIAAVVATLALTAGLAACAPDDELADAYEQSSELGFVAGAFQVEEIPEGERGEPVVFEGETEYGDPVSSADYAGEVLVVNFWFAECGPCRAEAPLLEELWNTYEEEGVGFLGVNIYDQAPKAIAFNETFGVTYPSVIDINDKNVGLAFASVAPLKAAPTTLVLDREGRVSARIFGQIRETSILATLVDDAMTGSA